MNGIKTKPKKMSEEELKITLPDGTEISWEDFVKSTPEDDITDEINKDILEKLNQNKDE
mgnify:CR=1 FL=1